MKAAWQVIAVVVVGAVAIDWAVSIIQPLFPFIVTAAVVGVIATVVIKRLRQW